MAVGVGGFVVGGWVLWCEVWWVRGVWFVGVVLWGSGLEVGVSWWVGG